MRLLIICLFSLALFPLSAQEKGSDFEKMNWISGSWVGEDKGHKLELNLSGTEGEVLLGNFKKLTPINELRFARFMNMRPLKQGGVVLQLYPFFQQRDDYYVSIELTESMVRFHRYYPNEVCNFEKVEDVLNDTGDQLKCDRFPVQIVYEKLSESEFQETYIGYQYHNGEHHDVSFSRTYKRR
jgi:hypothetical protein